MAPTPLDIQIEASEFPCERLRVRRLRGRERISELFAFEVDVICDEPGLDTERFLGADVSLVFTRKGAALRSVHGMIAGVDDMLDTEPNHRVFRFHIAPRFHRLRLVETHEVFVDLSIPDLVSEKMRLIGLDADIEMRLLDTYAKREFVTQFGETDLSFVSRLCEHLGIGFYFDHEGGRDRMVFSDHGAGYAPLPSPAAASYSGRGEEHGVFQIQSRNNVVPGAYVVRDYNYRTPQIDLTSIHEVDDAFGGGVIEYGGHFKTPEEGQRLARVRAEERRSTESYFTGRSDIVEFSAGRRIRLQDHPHLDGLEMLLVEVEHEATLAVHHAGTGEALNYRNTFRATDAARTYRPPRVTKKPRLHGLYNGVIDPGEKAGLPYSPFDDQGRYFVRFHFDSGPGERKASRPVRMAQAHAGENYGMHLPLKPGVEVVVGFVGGDPDRPVIVGAMHHPAKPSPVGEQAPMVHRILTEKGIRIDMVDGT